jgi:hypothetical protein
MENAAVNDYDLHKILGNLKAHIECKSNEEFRISLIKGMLLFLLVRYIFACNILRKEEENLRMIYILFTILLAQTLFYIEHSES